MRKQYFFIAVSLLVSLVIYLFYRTEKTVVNEIVIRAISWENYTTLRQAVNRLFPLNEFVIYSLPEGLWAFCITRMSRPYYIGMHSRRIPCIIFPLLACIGLEIAQLLHVTNGRFDPVDIGVTIFFWAIAAFAFGDQEDQQNLLTPINGKRLACLLAYGIVYLAHVSE